MIDYIMFDPGCHLFLSKGSKLIRAVCSNETITLSKRQGPGRARYDTQRIAVAS